jgi:hypothetical protein
MTFFDPIPVTDVIRTRALLLIGPFGSPQLRLKNTLALSALTMPICLDSRKAIFGDHGEGTSWDFECPLPEDNLKMAYARKGHGGEFRQRQLLGLELDRP